MYEVLNFWNCFVSTALNRTFGRTNKCTYGSSWLLPRRTLWLIDTHTRLREHGFANMPRGWQLLFACTCATVFTQPSAGAYWQLGLNTFSQHMVLHNNFKVKYNDSNKLSLVTFYICVWQIWMLNLVYFSHCLPNKLQLILWCQVCQFMITVDISIIKS